MGGLREDGRPGIECWNRDRRGGRKRGLQTSLQTEIIDEIDRLIGRSAAGEVDFEALETAARSAALRLAAVAVQQRLNADHSDDSGPSLLGPCGHTTSLVDRRDKTFITVLGPMELKRAYYHCAECKSGFFPRDRSLGMAESGVSPGVLRMMGNTAALVSFEEGSVLIEQLAAVSVTAKMVERYAEALGAEIAEDEKQNTAALDQSPLPSTLYLGIDGTSVPIRSRELAGRKGKQSDGTAKTREVKLCTVWSAETQDEDGVPVRDPGSVSYTAAIESASTPDASLTRSEFADRVLREATRRRFCQASRQVVLGDGAAWIWNLSHELFPQAIQIVDRFHVKQHLSDVAKAIHPGNPAAVTRFVQPLYDLLDNGHLAKLLGSLRPHMDSCEEAKKCYHYLRRNRHRMRYSRFHQLGLCTSSGVVEAGCKVAIGVRLKRSGMHWTVRGANAIIALRCCILSGQFEDFWERRSMPQALAA